MGGRAVKRRLPFRLTMNRAAFAVAVVLAALYGGSKGRITVDDPYIVNAGSRYTNDAVRVAVAARFPYVPADTPVLVYARPEGSTNALDWVRLTPYLTLAEHPYEYALANATNYDIMVAADFTPAPTVHTNGVWQMRGFIVPGTESPAAFGKAQFPNTRWRLWPTARDYVQNGIVGMWDGIENAGWMRHDPNAKEWKNLCGSMPNATLLRGTRTWTANSLYVVAGRDYWRIVINNFFQGRTQVTIEAVVTPRGYYNDRYTGSNRIFSSMESGGFAFQFHKTGNVYCSLHVGGAYRDLPSFGYEENQPLALSLSKTTSALIFARDGEYVTQYTGSGSTARGSAAIALAWEPDYNGNNAQDMSTYGGMTGDFHSLRIYSRALSADEVRHNYEIDRIRFNLP